ncbi:MAG: DEAD/DEAH box helicase, partial [Lachnospiraceae bacterium]|nr:DEAD/DEAH box helicase [Lachnospiraceae bacterium]
MQPEKSVRELRNIGPKTEQALNQMGIHTVADLLLFFPRTYERYESPIFIRETRYRDRAAVFGVIETTPVTRRVKKLEITETTIRDEEGSRIRAAWFHMPFLTKTLRPGTGYVFRGPITGSGPMRRLTQPKLYKKEIYAEMQKTLHPVYSLPKGISEKLFTDALREAVLSDAFPEDTLSEALRNDYGLVPIREALIGIHFPESEEVFQKARKRLVFEEFYRFLYKVRELKATVQMKTNAFRITKRKEVDELVQRLPFELTGAQKRVLSEIRENLAGASIMNRLIQGDVGSGKTILCFLAMYETALNGYESILMAPTEVLAKQHYENFIKLNETYDLGLRIRLLTGSMTAAEKKAVYQEISTHAADLIVGTHAVIQRKPEYEDLALVITDEQHRFGVRQRELLKEKGRDPHMIVLSATP